MNSSGRVLIAAPVLLLLLFVVNLIQNAESASLTNRLQLLDDDDVRKNRDVEFEDLMTGVYIQTLCMPFYALVMRAYIHMYVCKYMVKQILREKYICMYFL